MVHIPSLFHRSRRRWPIAAALVLLLGACEAPTRAADARDQHQVLIGKETVSLVVAKPAAGTELAGLEATKFGLFVRHYFESGQGQMTVSASGDAAEWVRELLVKEGIRRREIVVTPGAAGAVGAAVLTYTAATVAVPECHDWSANATFNWSNRIHGNFGCATRRNIGLMVRNPADLQGTREMGGGDGEHGAGVITNYRTAPKVLGPQKTKSATTKQQ